MNGRAKNMCIGKPNNERAWKKYDVLEQPLPLKPRQSRVIVKAAFSRVIVKAAFSRVIVNAAFSRVIVKAAFSRVIVKAAFSRVIVNAAFSRVIVKVLGRIFRGKTFRNFQYFLNEMKV